MDLVHHLRQTKWCVLRELLLSSTYDYWYY